MVHSLVKKLPPWLRSFYIPSDETHAYSDGKMALRPDHQAIQNKKYKQFCLEVCNVVNDCIGEGKEKDPDGLKLLKDLSSGFNLKTREDGNLDIPDAPTLIKIIEREPALGKKIIYRLVSDKRVSAYLRSPLKTYTLRESRDNGEAKAMAEASYDNDYAGFERFLMDMPQFLSKNKTSSKELKSLASEISESLSSFHNSNPNEDSFIHNKIKGSAKIGNCTFYSSGDIRAPSKSEAEKKQLTELLAGMASKNKGGACSFTATIFDRQNKNIGHDVAFHLSFDESGLVEKLVFVNSNMAGYPFGLVSHAAPMLKALSNASLLNKELKTEFSALEAQMATSKGSSALIASDTFEKFRTKYAPEISADMKVQDMSFDSNCIRYAFYNASTMAMLANKDTGRLDLTSQGQITEECRQKLKSIRPTGDFTKNFLLQGVFDFNRKRDAVLGGYNKFIKKNLAELKAANMTKKKPSARRWSRMIATMCNKLFRQSNKKDVSFLGRQAIDVSFTHKPDSFDISIQVSKANAAQIEPIISKILESVQKNLGEVKAKSSSPEAIESAALQLFATELKKYKQLIPDSGALTAMKDQEETGTVKKSLSISHKSIGIASAKESAPALGDKAAIENENKTNKSSPKESAPDDKKDKEAPFKENAKTNFRDKVGKWKGRNLERSI